MYMSPAQYVIHAIGGVRATAKIVYRTPAAVSKWKALKRKGGAAGRVPKKNHAIILAYACANAIDITEEDLKLGRRVILPKKQPWE